MNEETTQWAALDDEHEAISWYAQQIAASYLRLSLVDERALLARLAVSGCDEQAIRKRLIEGTLGSVLRWAKRYRGIGIPLADLVAQGNLALVEAGQAFVPTPNRLFRSYASVRIHQAFYRQVVENTHGLRAPNWAKQAIKRLNRRTLHGFQAVGVDLLDGADYRAAGLSEEQGEALRRMLEPPLSLDAPADAGEAALEPTSGEGASGIFPPVPPTWRQIMAERCGFDHEEEYARMALHEELQQGLAQLSPRLQQAIRLRFGFGEGERAHTLDEMGRILGCTRENARLLLEQGVRKLRSFFWARRRDVTLPALSWQPVRLAEPRFYESGSLGIHAQREPAGMPSPATPGEKPTAQPSPTAPSPSSVQAGEVFLGWIPPSSGRRGFMGRSLSAAGQDGSPRVTPTFSTRSPDDAVESTRQRDPEHLPHLPFILGGSGLSSYLWRILQQLQTLPGEQPTPPSHKLLAGDGSKPPLDFFWTPTPQEDSPGELGLPLEQLDQITQVFSTAAPEVWPSHRSARRSAPLLPPLHHSCCIETLAWQPDDLHLALIDQRGHLAIYDLASGRGVRTFHQHVPALPVCSWSADSRYIATATQGPGLWVREVTTKLVRLYYQGHRHQIRQLSWSPDGRLLASADRSSTHLLVSPMAQEGWVLLKKTVLDGTPLRLAWSPDATQLALVTQVRRLLPFLPRSARVQIWEVRNGRVLHIPHPEEDISDIAWSPDGRFVATVGTSARVWSARTGRLVASGQGGDKGGCWVRWTGDALIILSRSGHLRALHAMTGVELARYRVRSKELNCAAWSPDGTILAFTEKEGHTVSFWRMP